MTKHTPATPLPWTSGINPTMQGLPLVVQDARGRIIVHLEATGPYMERAVRPSVSEADIALASYIAHAANAYPKLVEALRLIAGDVDECNGKGGDGYVSILARAQTLLRELGEDA
jgi:hypothetical protein